MGLFLCKESAVPLACSTGTTVPSIPSFGLFQELCTEQSAAFRLTGTRHCFLPKFSSINTLLHLFLSGNAGAAPAQDEARAPEGDAAAATGTGVGAGAGAGQGTPSEAGTGTEVETGGTAEAGAEGSAGEGAEAGAAGGPELVVPEVDAKLREELEGMGFSAARCVRALDATGMPLTHEE